MARTFDFQIGVRDELRMRLEILDDPCEFSDAQMIEALPLEHAGNIIRIGLSNYAGYSPEIQAELRHQWIDRCQIAASTSQFTRDPD